MAKFGYGGFLLGWMIVIFLFSSQPFERQRLSPWLGRVLSRYELEPYLAWVDFEYGGRPVSIEALGIAGFAEFMIRKTAHLTEYAVLGALLLLLLRGFIRKPGWLLAASLLACSAFAAADEYRQSFVQGRTPLAADVLLDTCGACLGILLAKLAADAGRRRKHPTPPDARTKERTG